MPAELTVTGGPETAAAFDKLAQDVADLSSTHELVARARLAGVASRTPRATGALAGSWDASATATAGSILSPLPYAGPIEYGVAGQFIGAGMIAATLAEEAEAIVKQYDSAIGDRARARGFRVD